MNSLGIRRSGLILFFLIAAPFFMLKPPLVQGFIVVGLIGGWVLHDRSVSLGFIGQLFLNGLALGICWFQFATIRGIEPAITLLSLVALVQCIDLKTQKDFSVFILICQLLLLGQLLDEYSLWYAFYIMGISLFLFFLMARYHKTHLSKREQGGEVRRKLLRNIFLYSLPLTLLLFFLFPRLPLGNIFSFAKKPAGVTGFTNELRPGEIAKVAQDSSTYFRVRMREDVMAVPLLYWRGGILAQNEGFNWKIGKFSHQSDYKTKVESRFRYQVTMSTLESSPLFHLKGTKRLKRLTPGHKVQEPGGMERYHPFGNHKTKYEGSYSGVDKEWLVPKDKDKFLQVHESIGDKVKELAKTLDQGFPDGTYLAITDFLRKEKFSYTLSPGKQNLDQFLFSNKKGFCEHFSSATAILLRLNGIPARIITGFHGGLYNPNGGYFQVRGQDAHAWLEYWNGREWKRGDPTEVVAPDRINFGSDGFLLSSEVPDGMNLRDFMGQRRGAAWTKFKLAWDSFYNNLNQKFLDYDYSVQRDLFNFKKVRRYSGALLIGVCLLMLGLVTLYWRRKMIGRPHPLDKAYSDFLKKLKKAGIERKLGEGALSLESRLPKDWNSLEESREILQLYREIKYREDASKVDQFLTKTDQFRPAKIDQESL